MLRKKCLFEVMDDIFMSREVIIFTLSSLISSMLFLNVVSGSNFVASIMLYILICSKFLSRDAGILEIRFFCTIICDESLIDVSLITSVSSERNSVSVLRGTSYFLFCFYSWCYFTFKNIKYSYHCLKLCSDLSDMSWILVSKKYSEYEF